jgi:hypothetical protein
MAANVPDGSITGNKIAPGTVTSVSLADGTVSNSKLANNSITVTASSGLSGGGTVPLGGSVTLGLNLANPNTWTALQTFGSGITVTGQVQATERLNIRRDHFVDGTGKTIAGGYRNTNTADYAAIGGGEQNTASGWSATVGGGVDNTAGGDYSFAAGHWAMATDNGAFVWSSGEYYTYSWGNNTFTVRATGGVRFYTAGGTANGVQLASGSGSWSSLSDRNAKENFQPVDCRQILERVAALPVTTWNYKTQPPTIRHIGPMAQDFAAAFSVGENDHSISTVDADGVALAAIKGLYEELQTQKARNDALEKRIAELERLLANGGK